MGREGKKQRSILEMRGGREEGEESVIECVYRKRKRERGRERRLQ